MKSRGVVRQREIPMCPTGEVVWQMVYTDKTTLLYDPEVLGSAKTNLGMRAIVNTMQQEPGYSNENSQARAIHVRQKRSGSGLQRVRFGRGEGLPTIAYRSVHSAPKNQAWILANATFRLAVELAGAKLEGTTIEVPRIYAAVVTDTVAGCAMDFVQGEIPNFETWYEGKPDRKLGVLPAIARRTEFYADSMDEYGWRRNKHYAVDDNMNNSKVRPGVIGRFDLDVSRYSTPEQRFLPVTLRPTPDEPGIDHAMLEFIEDLSAGASEVAIC